MPKVSVIIPVYNVERYIGRCVQTLFGQTLDDMEFVFVNDCTPDRSMEVVAEVLEVFPHRKAQVKIVDLPVNGGLHAARRAGLAVATGEYIAHCDSDDYVDIDIYRLLWQRAVESGSEMVYCSFLSGPAGRMKPFVEDLRPQMEPHWLMRELGMGKLLGVLWRMLVHRRIYEAVAHWPVADMAEDHVVHHQLLFACRTKVVWLDKALYCYVRRPDQMTGARSRERVLNNVTQRVANLAPMAVFYGQTGLPFAKAVITKYKMNDKMLLSRLEGEGDYVELQRALHPELPLLAALCTRGLKRKYRRAYLRMQCRLLKKKAIALTHNS